MVKEEAVLLSPVQMPPDLTKLVTEFAINNLTQHIVGGFVDSRSKLIQRIV